MLALTGTDSKISNQELYIALGLVLTMLALKKQQQSYRLGSQEHEDERCRVVVKHQPLHGTPFL